MSEEQRQFRRGYRQGFHAAVKAFDTLLKEDRVPQEQVFSFLDSFAGEGRLFDWLSGLNQEGDSVDPPDAIMAYRARMGRQTTYKAG